MIVISTTDNKAFLESVHEPPVRMHIELIPVAIERMTGIISWYYRYKGKWENIYIKIQRDGAAADCNSYLLQCLENRLRKANSNFVEECFNRRILIFPHMYWSW